MKKILYILFAFATSINAQSLSPTVIASSGGYFSNGSGSLSWTLGETAIQTLTSPGNILTQGFQQPELKIVLMNLNAFLEGFYIGGGNMQTTLFDAGFTPDPTATDFLNVDLWNTTHLGNAAPDYTVTTILHKNGTATASFNGILTGNYYIALRHRNSIETWSSVALPLNSGTVAYDFSTSQTSAFGNNLSNIDMGKFGIFGGDVNQDDVVESFDYSEVENAVYFITPGYTATDITGDLLVESSDYSLMENNVFFIRQIIRP